LLDEIGLLVLRDEFSGQRVGGRSYDNDYAPVHNLRSGQQKAHASSREEEIKQSEFNVIYKSYRKSNLLGFLSIGVPCFFKQHLQYGKVVLSHEKSNGQDTPSRNYSSKTISEGVKGSSPKDYMGL